MANGLSSSSRQYSYQRWFPFSSLSHYNFLSFFLPLSYRLSLRPLWWILLWLSFSSLLTTTTVSRSFLVNQTQTRPSLSLNRSLSLTFLSVTKGDEDGAWLRGKRIFTITYNMFIEMLFWDLNRFLLIKSKKFIEKN